SIRTSTDLEGSSPFPYTIALASASDSATRRLNRAVCAPSPEARQWRAMRSTASSTTSRSVGTRTEITASPSASSGPPPETRRTQSLSGLRPASESGEGGSWGVSNVEQRVELGELEEGTEIFVQAGQAELAFRLANLAGKRDQHAETRGIDVPGVGEV